MKNTILKTLVIIITVLLCVPSLMYLINNNTVDQFDSYYTYSLNGYGGENRGIIEGIVVIGLLLLYSIIYLVLLKKNKECFKSVKNVIIFIAIISLLFMLILPFLSSDIYLVLFILLALYFLLKLNSKIFAILFLALSIAIKYSTVLIVPFILIYMYKDKSVPKRFAYCIISGLSIIGIVGLLYLPYYRDYTIFNEL